MQVKSVSVLLVDAGNTRLKWQLREGGEIQAAGFAGYDDRLTETLPAADKVVVASVAASGRAEALFAAAGMDTVILDHCLTDYPHFQHCYADPARLGVDRWLAMLGARRAEAGALIVIDAGTALTVDWLSAADVHEGGFILPGSEMAANTLFANTGRVRSYQDEENRDGTKPGQDTLSCVRNGVRYQGLALVSKLRSDYPQHSLVITGGDGQWLADSSGVRYCPDLVLDGMDSLCAGSFLA